MILRSVLASVWSQKVQVRGGRRGGRSTREVDKQDLQTAHGPIPTNIYMFLADMNTNLVPLLFGEFGSTGHQCIPATRRFPAMEQILTGL